MDTIHLWDNSWHVSGLDDSRIEELRNRDTYHRTPRCLNYYGVRGIAKKEVKARREFKSPDWIKQPDGWGEPYLVEVEVNLKKVEVE